MRQSQVHFAEGVTLHLLEENGLVLCENTQSLFELNTTAAFIWCRLEEDSGVQGAVAAVSTNLKVDESVAHSYVQNSLGEWEDAGLLRGSEGNRPATPESKPPQEAATSTGPVQPAVDENDSRIFENFRLVDSTFCISLPSSELRDLVYQSFASIRFSEAGRHMILVRPQEDGVYLLNDGPRIVAKAAKRNEIVPILKAYIAQVALSESTYFLALHSAALQADSGSFLLIGKAGSGKSTLAAVLVHQGFRYFSDDVTLLAEPDLSVRPFPMSIVAKEGSWTTLVQRYPLLTKAPVHLRWDKKNVRYLALEPHQFATPEPGQSTVRNLFFLSYNEGSDSSFARVRKTEAAHRLLTNDCYVPVNMTSAYIDRLINWFRSVDAYALSFADLDKAVGLIRSVTGPV